MAKKKRRIEPITIDPAEQKKQPRYKDSFQDRVGRSIEDAGQKLEGQGRNILYGIGALIVLCLIVWIFYVWNARSTAAAQTALGKAIETSQAPVTDTPLPPGSTQKTFRTEKERAEAAIAAFQAVADKYSGSVADKAKYFVAVNRLSIDRAAGMQDLQGMANTSSPVGKLAMFALAQAKADDGKVDEAVELYKQLDAQDEPLISKETIEFELAKLYEKQGRKQDAAELLFSIVKRGTEAKDLEGKPLGLSSTAENAKAKLKELDPARAAELPDQMPGGFDEQAVDGQ